MKKDKSQNSTTIDVSESVAQIINSRDVAEILEETIKKTDTGSVILDFSNVKFISRSAAHSLLLLKERLKNKFLNKKEVSFNAYNDVAEMIRVVAANRALSKEKKIEFNPERVDISSLLRETTA